MFLQLPSLPPGSCARYRHCRTPGGCHRAGDTPVSVGATGYCESGIPGSTFRSAYRCWSRPRLWLRPHAPEWWYLVDVRESIFIGVGLAVLVVFLFLGNWRSTLITGLSLPNSLIGAFVLMSVAGFSINIMTLLVLSLSISKPTESESARRVMLLMEKPATDISTNAPISELGNARPVMRVDRQLPKKRNTTKTARPTPIKIDSRTSTKYHHSGACGRSHKRGRDQQRYAERNVDPGIPTYTTVSNPAPYADRGIARVGNTAGGTAVTISGTGFQAGATVSLGGAPTHGC